MSEPARRDAAKGTGSSDGPATAVGAGPAALLPSIPRAPVAEAGAGGLLLDAVFVPTIGAPDVLAGAARFARVASKRLIALCSDREQARAASEYLTRRGVAHVAIAVPRDPCGDFESPTHPPANARDANDIGAKRNLALALGRLAGWSKVLLLDDDIEMSPAQSLAAIPHMSEYGVIGCPVTDFPDDCVAVHALRALGGHHDGFIGG